jgi:hypothetical protein
MSCDIRKYPISGKDYGEYEMSLTAFVGGKERGHSIQFTINGQYCQLGQQALIDLIATIGRRINCEEGFTATGAERENIDFIIV